MGVRRERQPVSQQWSQMSVGRAGEGWGRLRGERVGESGYHGYLLPGLCDKRLLVSIYCKCETRTFSLSPKLSHEIGVVRMGYVMRHASHNERLSRPVTHSACAQRRVISHFALGRQIASPDAYRMMCFNQFCLRDSASTCVKELAVQKIDFKVEGARKIYLFFLEHFTIFHYILQKRRQRHEHKRARLSCTIPQAPTGKQSSASFQFHPQRGCERHTGPRSSMACG